MDWKYKTVAVFVIGILIVPFFTGPPLCPVQTCLVTWDGEKFVWPMSWCFSSSLNVLNGRGIEAMAFLETLLFPLLLLAVFIRRRMDAWKTKRADT